MKKRFNHCHHSSISSFIGRICILVGFVGFFLPSQAEAVDCTRPISGSMTISSSCSFPATVDGVDAGTGSSNTADITVSSGTLTVAAGQTVSTGRLIPSGGNIVVVNTGQIKIGSPIWVTDADSDGYPATTTQVVQADAPTNGRRRNLMTSLTSTDCRDANASAVSCDPVSASLTTGINNRTFDAGSATIESNYHELPADINTVGLWHMNEASGNIADSSGNGNTGVPTGTTVVAGKLGNGRSFNGSSDRIIVSSSSSLQPANALTIEGWIQLNALNNWQHIVQKGSHSGTDGYNGYYIRITTSNKIDAYIVTGTNTEYQVGSLSTLTTGAWYHVASVYDGSTFKVYLNGNLENSVVASGAIDYTGGQPELKFGYNNNVNTPGYFLNGYMDEFRISNVARSPEEIKADAQRFPYSVYTSLAFDLGQTPITWTQLNYSVKGARTGDGETPVFTNSLVAQWNFNETSGTAAVSGGSCGTSCNGTLTTFASTSSQDQAAGTGWTANNKRWGAGALMFDGADDFVSVPDNAVWDSANGDYTYEFWMNPSSIPAEHDGIIGQHLGSGNGNPRLGIYYYQDQRIWFYNYNQDIQVYSISKIPLGQWTHVVLTKNVTSSNMYLYINGKLDNTVSISGVTTWTDLAYPLYIGYGRRSTAVASYFKVHSTLLEFIKAVRSLPGKYWPTTTPATLNSKPALRLIIPPGKLGGR